eukprot:GHVU01207339.1.p1 GENE.GHVU01207339.1~~GHVU01207339.1.p1  ORF type:complete len:135 (-),score=15.32 GHVU01207339.1:128-532(-)
MDDSGCNSTNVDVLDFILTRNGQLVRDTNAGIDNLDTLTAELACIRRDNTTRVTHIAMIKAEIASYERELIQSETYVPSVDLPSDDLYQSDVEYKVEDGDVDTTSVDVVEAAAAPTIASLAEAEVQPDAAQGMC